MQTGQALQSSVSSNFYSRRHVDVVATLMLCRMNAFCLPDGNISQQLLTVQSTISIIFGRPSGVVLRPTAPVRAQDSLRCVQSFRPIIF